MSAFFGIGSVIVRRGLSKTLPGADRGWSARHACSASTSFRRASGELALAAMGGSELDSSRRFSRRNDAATAHALHRPATTHPRQLRGLRGMAVYYCPLFGFRGATLASRCWRLATMPVDCAGCMPRYCRPSCRHRKYSGFQVVQFTTYRGGREACSGRDIEQAEFNAISGDASLRMFERDGCRQSGGLPAARVRRRPGNRIGRG